MAQETRQVNGEGWTRGMELPVPLERHKSSQSELPGATTPSAQSYDSLLRAMGDKFSRGILLSSIVRGKTIEEIHTEQGVPLSTCYRRVRQLLDEGLMILEKIVITQGGKRYAIYRTSFSDATIRLDGAEITLHATPNADVLGKLFTKWLSRNYPGEDREGDRREKVPA